MHLENKEKRKGDTNILIALIPRWWLSPILIYSMLSCVFQFFLNNNSYLNPSRQEKNTALCGIILGKIGGRGVEHDITKAATILERFTSQQHPNKEKEKDKETIWGKYHKNMV